MGRESSSLNVVTSQIDIRKDKMSDDLIDRLVAHKTLGSAPREELSWLVAHGTLRELAVGDQLSWTGRPVVGMFVVLRGHIAIFVDRGAGRHKVMDWRAGDVTGALPYSRIANAPGDSIAQEPSEVIEIQRSDLEVMSRECHQITSILVHKMLDRARVFTSSGLHDEKMASLGRLSAGLAHELNNPAAAIERSAAVLGERLAEAHEAARALGAARLTEAQLESIDTVHQACFARPLQGVLSPMQRADREDGIADWLAAHGVDDHLAAPLSDTTVTMDALTRIAAAVDRQALKLVLQWVATECSVRTLTSEIQDAAMRISGLVTAIKHHTYMDRSPVAEAIDLTPSIGNSITVLRAKAREKSITVTVDVEAGLPRVRALGGELNQIWGNLLENALDAAPESGHVEVTAKRERQGVVVRIIDDGSGIPDEIRNRLFEPFVTTKPVGKGTGLGLNIVRQLVNHNDAEIDYDTAPGRTEFRVWLPLAEPEAVAGS